MSTVAGTRLARAMGVHADKVQAFAKGHPGLVLAGGVVRDALMGRLVKDIDFAVEKGSARGAGKAFADAAGGALVMLGQDRLARVVLGDATVDFTPLRAKTLEEDLRLRDFTVNAMAVRMPWGRRAGIVDPTGGVADLEAKRLRICGPRSFRDDPVRLWRAHRQAVQLGLRVHPGTARLMSREARLAGKCSAERLRDELFKLFEGYRPAAVLRAAARSGVLEATFPVFRAMRNVRVPGGKGTIRVLDHTLEALEHLEDSLRRLRALYPKDASEMAAHLAEEPVTGRSRKALLGLAMALHDTAKPKTIRLTPKGDVHFYEHEHLGARLAAGILRDRLRVSEREIGIVAHVIHLHLRPGYLAGAGAVTDKAAYRMIRDAGDELFELVLHAEADRKATHHGRMRTARGQRGVVLRILAFRRDLRARVPAVRLVSGHDLMRELALEPGPLIGDLLRGVDEAVALGKARTRDEALAVARGLLPGLRKASAAPRTHAEDSLPARHLRRRSVCGAP
ncbi:MAG: hypothetical protein AAB152_17830 [Candidatus Coatesbacteria bacterium]